LAKFHEERGKIKCECLSCEVKKRIRAEVEQERKKIIDDYEKNQEKEEIEEIESECAICYKYRKKQTFQLLM